ncbi:hypothetical protein [Haliscomenobacter hydrossis]|uniref:hypothetical protein n=1 Tax=Haliscomenobacter hydrossis TaxID=2350 RepID=UPI00030E8DA5|nr:hypothetical protein [Haliscomenobacter hydrossis]
MIFGGNTRSGAVEEGDTLLVEKTFSSEEILNMFQENNKNVLAITTDFKNISKKIAEGEGTIGKLLAENTLYDQLNSTTASLQNTSQRAEVLVNSLVDFSAGLNKKGTLANELTTDTTVFKSVKASVFQLKQATDNAAAMVANLKTSSSNPNTPMGVLIQDQKAGTQLKGIIENLEGSSQKLEENMEALQHNFLLRGFFKKKAKKAKQDSLLIK